MRVRTGLAVFVQVGLALAGSCGLAWGQAKSTSPTPFTREVEAHFDAWDRNHNGALEADEIDALVVKEDLKGPTAAAVAALKAAQRSEKFELPALTLEYFHTYEAEVASGKKPQPAFDQTFSRGSRRISHSRRDLFADGVPNLESCHQGPLGDCFFVAVVGASVVRDPGAVRSMIKQERDGSCTVSFPNGKQVHVPALTDTELALTSTTGNDGLWLALLEKAYGTLRNEGLPEEKQTASTTDAIARGGSTTTTIRLMTGHSVSRIGLRPRTGGKAGSRKTEGDKPDGKGEAPVVDETALKAHLDATLPGLREQLVEAMTNHRLAAAGTPKEGTLPPGINGSHAYAILGYDRGTDVVKLWNPHGNTFHPKGAPGLQNGYPTKAGHFEMPLTELGRVFNGVTIETEKPAQKS
jgi:hypothetical protein